MNHRKSQRKSFLIKKRQNQFVIPQSLKQMVLPEYNALHDPCLKQYFTKPFIKKNLRETGVIKKKKVFSLDKLNQKFNHLRHKNLQNTQGLSILRPLSFDNKNTQAAFIQQQFRHLQIQDKPRGSSNKRLYHSTNITQ